MTRQKKQSTQSIVKKLRAQHEQRRALRGSAILFQMDYHSLREEQRSAREALRDRWEDVLAKLRERIKEGKALKNAIEMTIALCASRANAEFIHPFTLPLKPGEQEKNIKARLAWDEVKKCWEHKRRVAGGRMKQVKQKLHEFKLDEIYASRHVGGYLKTDFRVLSIPGMLFRMEENVKAKYFNVNGPKSSRHYQESLHAFANEEAPKFPSKACGFRDSR